MQIGTKLYLLLHPQLGTLCVAYSKFMQKNFFLYSKFSLVLCNRSITWQMIEDNVHPPTEALFIFIDHKWTADGFQGFIRCRVTQFNMFPLEILTRIKGLVHELCAHLSERVWTAASSSSLCLHTSSPLAALVAYFVRVSSLSALLPLFFSNTCVPFIPERRWSYFPFYFLC